MVRIINIKEEVLSANKDIAQQNQVLLNKHRILLLNVMASPGAGKTSLILATINGVKNKIRIGVIEGDIASTVDADKINAQNIPVIQINTAGGCHLEANMIAKALDSLPLQDIDVVFIENVGNLVCPAEFALGEHKRVILLSVPEGDDKPIKYPLMFTDADVVLITKSDVMPYFDFNIKAFTKSVDDLNPKARILKVSCKTGEGMEAWLSWLEGEVKRVKTAKA
jgi:hydrogenase nickel incorporation protein HypB